MSNKSTVRLALSQDSARLVIDALFMFDLVLRERVRKGESVDADRESERARRVQKLAEMIRDRACLDA